ncbi:MAG: MFS transporter, partial [Pseudomonadota bacterium]
WKYVFFTSAAIHALNFLILLKIKEPTLKHSLDSAKVTFLEKSKEFGQVFIRGIVTLFDPVLFVFLLVFSGFWLMFMQLFDLLPNFITDWVDTSSVSIFFGQLLHKESWVAYGMSGQQLPAEWFINLDAGVIIILMLPIGWFFGRMKAVPAMTLGIVVATVGLIVAGITMNPWFCLLGIFVFAIGEMIASPRKSQYLAMLAPPEKKALYMGYVNFPVGIGWMLGSKLAGPIYQFRGDKLTLAKRYLTDHLGFSPEQIKAIAPEKMTDVLAQQLHLGNAREATIFLFNTYHPQNIWWIFSAIGMASMLGMIGYYLFVLNKKQKNV